MLVQAKETFENWFMQQSYIIADNDCKHILTKGSFTYEEQLAEVTCELLSFSLVTPPDPV